MTPHASRYPSRRASDAMLALALLAVVGLSVASMMGYSPRPLSSNPAPRTMYGPITGFEYADYLRANEAQLRSISKDFDARLMQAIEIGDRSMVQALRETFAGTDPVADEID